MSRHPLLSRTLAVATLTLAILATTATAAPPAATDDALALINGRYRVPMGLAPLVAKPELAKAAQSHADYWVLNNITPGGSAHTEVPGAPGFTGVNPWDRCLAAGADSCGEVAFLSMPMSRAVAGWLATPAHGGPLVFSEAVGFGESARGSAGNLTGSVVWGSVDPQAPVNTQGASLRMWPAEGTADVPLTWWGGESPDPLASYTGDRQNVGPVFFLITREDTDLSLSGASGPVPLLRPFTDDSGEVLRLAADSATGIFAARRLSPSSAYTLTAVHGGRTEQTHFTTEAAPPPWTPPVVPIGPIVIRYPDQPPDTVDGPLPSGRANPTPTRPRCRVAVSVSRARRTLIRTSGSCAGLKVQALTRRGWIAWPARRTVSGRQLVWRARQGGRTIASGRAAVPRPRHRS